MLVSKYSDNIFQDSKMNSRTFHGFILNHQIYNAEPFQNGDPSPSLSELLEEWINLGSMHPQLGGTFSFLSTHMTRIRHSVRTYVRHTIEASEGIRRIFFLNRVKTKTAHISRL